MGATEFIPSGAPSKNSNNIIDSETEKDNVKEMQQKLAKFLNTREVMLLHEEDDVIDLNNIIENKNKYIYSIDINKIKNSYNNLDKKIYPYFTCLQKDNMIKDSLNEIKVFMLPECYYLIKLCKVSPD